MEENGQGIIDLDNRSMEEEEEEGETGGGETREDVECNSKEPARRTLSFRNTYKIPKRKAPEFTMLQTLLLSYQSLGVVYGDIGTSPLYVYSSVTLENPTEGDILRLLSLIFWTLTMKGLIKYVLIVLDADDHGEGGTFALYTLIRQHINFKGKMIMPSTRLESDINLRFHSGGSTLHSKAQTFLEENATAQTAITLIVLLATCMLIGDEALTPTISVLSAVQGIQSRSSKITTDDVVWMCVGILLILFLCQRFGTSRVSFTFSPIMLLWFGFNVAIGIYNITTYYPLVLKAISPHYIYYFFERNGKKGWELLGAAALCITGAEAMFADLGHFNKKAIQAFSFLVYPALILAYAGQAAYLIKNPDNISTTFYSSMPEPLFWVMFVISTLAAIVASQALISASFSIIRQSIALGCFPRVTMIHTSNKHEGQNYSPEINFILMILSIIITVYFKGGVEIGNAYGVAVIWVMLITTFLISIVMIVIWDTNNILVAIFLFIFLSIEGVYMTSLLNKVRAGGWVPFAISAFFIVITLSWTYGRSKKSKYEEMKKMDRTELNELITSSTRVPGVCFFCTDLINGIPPIVRHYVQHIGSLRQVMVFVTVRTLPVKSVLPEERFHVAKLGPYGIYRCLVQYGYMNEHNMEGDEYVQEVIANLKEIAENNQEIQMLDSALNSGAIFVLGRIILKMSNSKDQLGKFVVHYLYRFLQKNFRSNVATLRIPLGKILQVGMVYEIE